MQKFRKIIIDLFDEGAGAAHTATGGNDSGSNTDSAKNTNAVRSDIAKKGRDLGLSDDLMQSYQEAYDSKHESENDTAAANHDDNTNEGQNSENQIEEEFKNLIRNNSFVSVGKMFGVSDAAIRKWCDSYKLPRKVSDIKKISDKDWENI